MQVLGGRARLDIKLLTQRCPQLRECSQGVPPLARRGMQEHETGARLFVRGLFGHELGERRDRLGIFAALLADLRQVHEQPQLDVAQHTDPLGEKVMTPPASCSALEPPDLTGTPPSSAARATCNA